jgi:hypothetical protein
MRAEKTVRELRDALIWAAEGAKCDTEADAAGLRMMKTHSMLLTWVLGEDAPGAWCARSRKWQPTTPEESNVY